MQRFLPAAAILLWSVFSPAAAQEHPDFSGTWKMDPVRSESAHQAVPIGPVTVVIKQTPSELSIETRRESNETLTYRLDGTESTTTGRYGVPIKVKAHWDGDKLITETERTVQGSTVTQMFIIRLDAGGKELVIDKTLTIQHGYQGEGAKATGRGKDVFVKRKR